MCECSEGGGEKGGGEIRRIMVPAMGRNALGSRRTRANSHPRRNIAELPETAAGSRFTQENREPRYPHLSSAAQSKDVKSPAFTQGWGLRGSAWIWEHFTSTVVGLPGVKLCLLLFFSFHWVIIRELLSRQMLNLLLLHLAFQNNE